MPLSDLVSQILSKKRFEIVTKWFSHIGFVWTCAIFVGTLSFDRASLRAFSGDSLAMFQIAMLANIAFFLIVSIWSHAGERNKIAWYRPIRYAIIAVFLVWILAGALFRGNHFPFLIFAFMSLNALINCAMIYAFFSYGQRFYRVSNTTDGKY